MARINGFNYRITEGTDGEPVAKRVLTRYARRNPNADVVTPQVDRDGKPTGNRVEWIFPKVVAAICCILLLGLVILWLSQVSVLPV